MKFINKYSGWLALCAIIIALIVAFTGKSTVQVVKEIVSNPMGAINTSTGYNFLEYQGLGTTANYLSVGGANMTLGTTEMSAVSSTTLVNNTGKDLTAWYNFNTIVSSSTMLYTLATSTTAQNSDGGPYTLIPATSALYTQWRVATGTTLTFSSLTATTTGYGRQGGPFIWKNGEYLIFQRIADAKTCASGSGSSASDTTRGHCSAATSTDTSATVHVFVSE